MSVWPNGTISKFVCLSQGGNGMGEPSQRKTLLAIGWLVKRIRNVTDGSSV